MESAVRKIEPRRMKCPLNGFISAALWAFGGRTAPLPFGHGIIKTICCSNIKILPIYSHLEFSSVIFEGKKKKEMISIEDCKFEKKGCWSSLSTEST